MVSETDQLAQRIAIEADKRVRALRKRIDQAESAHQAAVQDIAEKDVLIGRLREWITDLQAGTYVTCVYCGHRYGPDDEIPTSMAEVLKQHVEQCPEHPMSALKRDLEGAKRALREAYEVSLTAPDHYAGCRQARDVIYEYFKSIGEERTDG